MLTLILTACGATADQRSEADASSGASGESAIVSDNDNSMVASAVGESTTTSTTTTTTTPAETTTTTEPDQYAPPEWLGTVALPLRADGHGEARTTPDELVVRQIRTVDVLDPPAGSEFEASIGPVPDEVLARSTWNDECPVEPDDLSYVTVSYVGFEGRFHTGELLVNARVADGIVEVFRILHEARYPIEEMTVLTSEAMEAAPTGDRNNTSAFECRSAVGSGSFSQHAYGLAIDVNPFQTPYNKGDLVLPELASAYLDRTRDLPGMIHADGPVVDAFASIGWQWGGFWNSLKDYHHFSDNGR